VRELGEVHQVQQLRDPLLRLRLRPLADLEPERDVLRDAHVLEGRVVLEHEAHVALLRGQVRGLDPLDVHRALVGRLEAGDDPQQCGLAATRRPEERGELPGGNAQRDVLQGDEVAEPLADVLDLDAHDGFSAFRTRSSGKGAGC
jgi:hypothetical protein